MTGFRWSSIYLSEIHPNRQDVWENLVTIQLSVFGRGYSPPPRGGGSPPLKRRRAIGREGQRGWPARRGGCSDEGEKAWEGQPRTRPQLAIAMRTRRRRP